MISLKLFGHGSIKNFIFLSRTKSHVVSKVILIESDKSPELKAFSKKTTVSDTNIIWKISSTFSSHYESSH